MRTVVSGDAVEVGDGAQLPVRPLVSVLVITYMHEHYLRQSVESIAAQKIDFPMEIVIAEDCSPDGTLQVALDLQQEFPALVRVVHNLENKGANRNLRAGLNACRGSYIAGCEGDDFWVDEHKLARQVAALDARPNVDLAFSRGYLQHPDGRAELGWDYGPECRVVPAKELFAGLGWIVPSASMLWRAKVTAGLPEWLDDSPFADVILLMAATVRGGAYYDPAPTIAYRVAQPTSFSVRLDAANRSERIRFLEGAVKYMRKGSAHFQFPYRLVRHRVDDLLLSSVKLQVAGGRYLSALRAGLGIDPAFLAKGLWRRLSAGRLTKAAR